MKNFFTYVNICIFSPTPPHKIPSNSYISRNCKICRPEKLKTAGSFRASTISRNQQNMFRIITSPNYQCHHHYFLVRFDYIPFQRALYVHVMFIYTTSAFSRSTRLQQLTRGVKCSEDKSFCLFFS